MMAWVLSACLSSSDCFRKEVFCAALVTDTLGLNDHGINQDAWAGLQEAKASGLVDIAEIIESVDPRDYEKNIIYFAERGYDVIVTAGAGLDDQTFRVSSIFPYDPTQERPGSVFVGLNQAYKESRPNLIAITFPEDQMGFAAGLLAARLSKTGIVAGICETSGIDAMWRYCEGFRAGAEYLPDVKVRVLLTYREGGDSEKLFIDDTWGYETAHDQIFKGADVIFAAGGATGQGALRAATDFEVQAIGTERDQGAALGVSGRGVVTSFYGQAGFEVQEVMRLLKAGNLPASRMGQIQLVPLNPAFPPEQTIEIETLINMLFNGEISTNIRPEAR